MSLFADFKRHLLSQSLLISHEKIVVAASGGLDSTVLLHLLKRTQSFLPFEIIVAHLNHGLRKEESQRDQDFVREMAFKHSCLFETKTLPPDFFPPRKNLQQEARVARYRFFEEMALRHRSTKVFTAHHANDQAETFFLRLLRGAGTEGLAGMKSARPIHWGSTILLVRPLLSFPRSQLEEYAQKEKLCWMEDSSNEKEDYLRNQLRHRWFKEFEAMNPRWVEKLSRSLEILQSEHQWLEDWIEHQTAPHFQSGEKENRVSLAWLQAQHKAVRYRVYRKILKDLMGLEGIQGFHFDQIDHLVLSHNLQMRVTLPRGFSSCITQQDWIVKQERDTPPHQTTWASK